MLGSESGWDAADEVKLEGPSDGGGVGSPRA